MAMRACRSVGETIVMGVREGGCLVITVLVLTCVCGDVRTHVNGARWGVSWRTLWCVVAHAVVCGGARCGVS